MYLANFFTPLILLIFILVLLLFIYPVKVAASFNSEQQPDIYLAMSWLGPFLKGFIKRQSESVSLSINLFNKRILVKDLSNKKYAGLQFKLSNYMDYISMAKSVKINKAMLNASYGFTDPAVTGMLCGALDIILQHINLDEIFNNADFFTDHSYFYISGEAEVNAAVSLVRILRRKTPYLNAHALGGNR